MYRPKSVNQLLIAMGQCIVEDARILKDIMNGLEYIQKKPQEINEKHTLRTIHQHSFCSIMNKIKKRVHTATQQINILAIEGCNKRLVQFLVQLSRDHISTMLVLLDVLVQRFLFFRQSTVLCVEIVLRGAVMMPWSIIWVESLLYWQNAFG